MAMHMRGTKKSELFTELTYPVNYRYKVGKAWVQMEEFLLMTGMSLVIQEKLHASLIFYIAEFLAPIDYTEAASLSLKLSSFYKSFFNKLNILKEEKTSEHMLISP